MELSTLIGLFFFGKKAETGGSSVGFSLALADRTLGGW